MPFYSRPRRKSSWIFASGLPERRAVSREGERQSQRHEIVHLNIFIQYILPHPVVPFEVLFLTNLIPICFNFTVGFLSGLSFFDRNHADDVTLKVRSNICCCWESL